MRLCAKRELPRHLPSHTKKKKQTKKVSGVKLLKNMTVLQFGVGSLK